MLALGPRRSSSPAATASAATTSSSTAREAVAIGGERHPERRRPRLRLHPLLGPRRLAGARRQRRSRRPGAPGEIASRGGRRRRCASSARARARSTSSASIGEPLGSAPVDLRNEHQRRHQDQAFPRPRSATVFDGPDRAHSRAYMKGIGFDDDALSRPTIGIANTWTEAMPCNFHLRGLAEHVKEGVRAAGGTPMEFNTVAVSDGVTMGTQGMKASLVSREVIADSIELMARGYQFDAIVALCACDKTIPGCAMALARLDVPSVLLYGGSIAPGHWHGRDVTILDIFEAIGAHNAGDMSDEELNELEGVASPGAGACGGQFTANTMACAFEALGISAGGSAMVPAEDDDKGTRRRADRRARHQRPRRGHPAEQGDHPRLARERDRLRLRLGRLDQRRPPPDRRRPRARHRARHGRLRADLARDAALRRPQAGRALRRHRPLRRRRRAGDPQAPRREGRPPRGRDHGHRQDDRRGRRRSDRGAGPGGRPAARRPAQGRRRPGDPQAATSPPKAPWSSSPAPSAPSRPARPASSSPKRNASARSRTSRSNPATSS